jgi:hypothetical protein
MARMIPEQATPGRLRLVSVFVNRRSNSACDVASVTSKSPSFIASTRLLLLLRSESTTISWGLDLPISATAMGLRPSDGLRKKCPILEYFLNGLRLVS